MLARLLAIAFTLAPLASALPTSGSTDLRPRIELVVRQNINDQSADALGAVIDITGVALSDIADIGEGLLKRDQAHDVYTALSGLKSKIDSTITRLNNVGVHGTNAPVTSKQSNEPPNLSPANADNFFDNLVQELHLIINGLSVLEPALGQSKRAEEPTRLSDILLGIFEALGIQDGKDAIEEIELVGQNLENSLDSIFGIISSSD